MADRNWQKDIQPLIKKYKGKKFPLNYGNTYELVVMVILAAQDSDAHINNVAPDLFKAFPDMKSLTRATTDTLHPLLSKVRNFGNKTKWLMGLAAEVKDNKNIPLTMDELTALPGIGRKSANVIMRVLLLTSMLYAWLPAWASPQVLTQKKSKNK
jgi:endonuclease-3